MDGHLETKLIVLAVCIEILLAHLSQHSNTSMFFINRLLLKGMYGLRLLAMLVVPLVVPVLVAEI